MNLLLIFINILYLIFGTRKFKMPKSIVRGKVSIDAIRRANQRKRRKIALVNQSNSNGEIHIKYPMQFGLKEVVITKEQIRLSYSKAFNRNAKKL